MNYELFMGEALAEARNAIAQGERPNAAVAVVDEAMVARAHDRVFESNDPTAHAVVVALREAARKLGKTGLVNATIFTTLEPCAMCVGALLERGVRVVDGAALEKRCAKAPRVRIPPSPPSTPAVRTPMPALIASGPRSRTS